MKPSLCHSGIVTLTLLCAGAAQAQTTLKMDGVWRGSVGAGASVSSGNSKSTSVNFSGEMVRLSKADKTRVYATSLYGKNNGVESANLIRAGGRYDYDFTPTVFGFGGIDLERDKIANLKFRVAPGVGLGYHLIKTDATTFDVFAGVGYVKDTFYRPVLVGGSVRDSYGRAELLVGEESTHKLSESTSFRQRLVVYPNLDDRGEYRAVFDSGLAVAMSSRLSLTLGLVSRYNSDPGPGVKKTDTLFVTGIAAKIE